MARGPAFNKNLQIHSLNNVDIYHIACRILNIKPNPYANAGSLQNLTNIFRTVIESTSKTGRLIPSFFILIILFLISFNF